MALLGINSVAPSERKRSVLEEIESGVNIASKVLGGGLDFYKTVTLGRPAAETENKLKTAQTKYYEAQAAKESSASGAGALSDVDKKVLDSYKDYKLTHEKGANDNSVAIYLPVSGRTLYGAPSDQQAKEKVFDTEGKLRQEFRTDDSVKAFRLIHGATKATMDAFADNDFDRGDSGRDLSLLFNYMKVLDPGSRVTGSEVELTTQASPLMDQVVQAWKKLKSNKDDPAALLAPGLRRSLVENLMDNYVSREADFNGVVDHYKFVSDAQGVDWNRVIVPLQGLDLSSHKKRKEDQKDMMKKKSDLLNRLGQ